MTAMLCRSMRPFAWNAGCAILTPSALASSLRATMQPSFDDRTTAGTAFERGTEDPFAGDEEVIAVGQSVDAHGRLRITPATTPQTWTSSPSIAAKGRAISSPSIAAMTMEPVPGVRERSTIRVSPARIPCSAMPPPSTVTKNVAAGRFMK